MDAAERWARIAVAAVTDKKAKLPLRQQRQVEIVHPAPEVHAVRRIIDRNCGERVRARWVQRIGQQVVIEVILVAPKRGAEVEYSAPGSAQAGGVARVPAPAKALKVQIVEQSITASHGLH